MRITFTTVVRRVPHQQGGEIVSMDWSTKRILARQPMVPTDPDVADENPRGGARGGRGILPLPGNRMLAATYHTLHIFDQTLCEVQRLSDNLFVGLHEMCFAAEKNCIWAAATAIDAALRVDLASGTVAEVIQPRAHTSLQGLLGLQPSGVDVAADNRLAWLETKHNDDPSHTHMNATCVVDGRIHLLLNRYGVVYDAVRDRVVVHDPTLAGAHNLRLIDGHFAINDTRGKAVRFYDVDTGACARTINLLDYAPIAKLNATAEQTDSKARAIFVRGLEIVNRERLFVGFSPASIAEINLRTGALIDLFTYSTRVRECVHGLVAHE